eukprot:763282-Hanusia_phi.AAC.2
MRRTSRRREARQEEKARCGWVGGWCSEGGWWRMKRGQEKRNQKDRKSACHQHIQAVGRKE